MSRLPRPLTLAALVAGAWLAYIAGAYLAQPEISEKQKTPTQTGE